MSKAAIGAKVIFCNHDGAFYADIFRIGNVNVVNSTGSVSADSLERPAEDATHQLVDFPHPGFWNQKLGVFVVPEEQGIELEEETNTERATA